MPPHQVHFRINEREYQFLLLLTADSGESMASVVRRLIRSAMVQVKKGGTTAVSVPLIDTRNHSTNA
jgi:hypothetical protein